MCTYREVQVKFLKTSWWYLVDNQEAIDVINQAIAVFDSLTCVQWRPYSTSLAAEVGHDAYINFYSGRWGTVDGTSYSRLNLHKCMRSWQNTNNCMSIINIIIKHYNN